MLKCSLALLMVCLFLVPHLAFAKPAPPHMLGQYFKEFLDMEETVEEGEWDEALEWLEKFSREKSFMTELKATVSAQSVDALGEKVLRLEDALRTQNASLSREKFLELHRVFLDIISNYDFKITPLAYILQNDLNEMDEALEDWDVAELHNEIKDIDEFYPQFSAQLVEKGASLKLVNAFKNELDRLKSATLAKDRAAASASLAELKKLLSAQVQLLSSRK